MRTLTAKQLFRTVLLTASAVVVGVIQPGPGYTASPKVDVCHREGNGSFHLITVAYHAVQAHRTHGDALPGDAVPGNPGYKFDDTCAQVAASICPCHFGLTDLAAIGIDGNPDHFSFCQDTVVGVALAQFPPSGGGTAATYDGSGDDGPSYCNRVLYDTPDGTGIELVTPLTTGQFTACAADLRAAGSALGLAGCP